jgi:predicted MPP superfamily phosphohydrolase
MPDFRMYPDGILLGVSVGAQLALTSLALATPWFRRSNARRHALRAVTALDIALFCVGYLTVFGRVARLLTPFLVAWIQATSLIWAMLITGTCVAAYAARLFLRLFAGKPQADSGIVPRRRLLEGAAGLLFALPVAATTFGIMYRNDLRLTEVDIPIPNLHPDLEGIRIVQITDVHLSQFLSEAELARAIDMANGTRAHIALMTGDLITRIGDPLDACLQQLARLKADAGVLGCLGNHEIATHTEDYVTEQGRRIGIDFLRKTTHELRFGNAVINFAGVDYQRSKHAYLVGMEKLVSPGKLNVILSHNPDVFRVAARQGYELMIAGHTHGGQVNVEILNDNLNLARFVTPFTRGLYSLGDARGYVSSGIGTVGMPVRLGAPAEINLLTLRRA